MVRDGTRDDPHGVGDAVSQKSAPVEGVEKYPVEGVKNPAVTTPRWPVRRQV